MKEYFRLNSIYKGMKLRCYGVKSKDYKWYGGRGITVCPEWLNPEKIYTHNGGWTKGWKAFEEWALANGYSEELTLDRIDVSKGYSPENCRWVSRKVQCNNRHSNRYITFNGETKTLQQWADFLKIHKNTLRNRLNRGWSVEKALTSSIYKN